MRAVYSSVLKGKSFLTFYGAIRASQSKSVYCLALRDYARFLARNNLIAADNDADLLLSDVKTVETWAIAYISDQKDRNLSYSIIAMRKAALRLFYDMNDITANWKKITKNMPEDLQHTDRPYTRQEIKKMLAASDLRAKVIILLMTSAGLRIGAIPELKVGNLAAIENHNLYQIIVYNGTKSRYITYCTPECKAEIDNYLKMRERYGENIDALTPLIRDQYDKLYFLRNKDSIKAKPLSILGIKSIVRDALLRSGLRQAKPQTESEDFRRKRHEVKVNHGLRKFFDTESTQAGVHPIYVEMLMGHNMALKGSYFKPTPLALLEGNDKMGGYIQAIDALTINDEYRLQKQVKELQTENLELSDVRREIDEIKAQLKNR